MDCNNGDNKAQTPPKGRDALDEQLTAQLRKLPPIPVASSLPVPSDDEPSDDELLMVLDEVASGERHEAMLARILEHPFSAMRLEVLRQALRDTVFSEASERVRLSPDEQLEPTDDTKPADTKPAGSGARIRSNWARLVFAVKGGAERSLAFIRGSDLPLSQAVLATRSTSSEPAQAVGFSFKHCFDGLDSLIHIEQADSGTTLRLELSCSDAPMPPSRVSLHRDGELVQSLKSQDGLIGFHGLLPARYTLAIAQHGRCVGNLELSILSL